MAQRRNLCSTRPKHCSKPLPDHFGNDIPRYIPAHGAHHETAGPSNLRGTGRRVVQGDGGIEEVGINGVHRAVTGDGEIEELGTEGAPGALSNIEVTEAKAVQVDEEALAAAQLP